jgi:copper chaperone CopZ
VVDDLDTTLGEQLFDVTVGQTEAEIPTDRQHDHVGWETVAGEGGSRSQRGAMAADSHAGSLTARTPTQPTQQSRMTCRRCVREVTSRLRDVPGLERVTANPARSLVHLSGSMTLADVLAAFEGTTYRPVVQRGA